ASVHICLYIADQMFDLAKVASEIVLRLYLTIGFCAGRACGPGRDFDRWHGAPTRAAALAAAASGRLWHRAVGAHPFLSADQSRHLAADVCRRPVRLVDGVPHRVV